VVKYLQERRQDEKGFTLIELMVVVLIMGILMAIAIPTFLSTQGSANDSGAKSNATNVLTSEKAYYEDNQVYLDAGSVANGSTLDPNMPWSANGAAPTVKNTVVADVGSVSATTGAFTASTATVAAPQATGQAVIIMDLSKSGDCFYTYDNEGGTSPVLAYAETSGGCFAPTGTFPPASPAASLGNAGAHIGTIAPVYSATAANTYWYGSW
jgi:type IV pilus assembly protein PilA